jgi:hypothetical protein
VIYVVVDTEAAVLEELIDVRDAFEPRLLHGRLLVLGRFIGDLAFFDFGELPNRFLKL